MIDTLKENSLVTKLISENKHFILGVIGTNRTGKLTTIRHHAKIYRKAHPKNKIIAFDPTDHMVKDELVNLKITSINRNWMTDLCEKNLDGSYKYADTLVVLNHYRMLHGDSESERDLALRDLFILSEKINMSIIYSAHAPALILESIAPLTSHLAILYTSKIQADFPNSIKNIGICELAVEKINELIDEIKGGMDDYNVMYPYFPYIMIDLNNNEIQHKNIESLNSTL